MGNSNKSFNCIGHINFISPPQIELFHLRLLLLHVKGATNFESLKTVIIQPSFTSTCLALELIEDDDEWARAMEEATMWMMPARLRQLFVRILIHCHPVHPEDLWSQFKNAMSEDFSRTNEIEISHQLAYAHMNNLLNKEGRSLSDFLSIDQTIIEINISPETHKISLTQMYDVGQQQYM